MMKNSKIKTLFILFILFLVIGIAGFTLAIYETEDTFNNLFSSAIYQTSIAEQFVSPSNWKPGDTTQKSIEVTNTGNIPVKARVSYTETWEDPNGNTLPLTNNNERVSIINFDNTDDWTKIGNYYYYNETIDPNDSSNSFISSVTFNPNITNDYTCSTVGNKTTCVSNNDSYEGGKYTLTINVETIQADAYEEVWDPEGPTLYGKVKKEYTDNTTYAGLYDGNHKDSFTRTASKDIYYYKTPNTTTSSGNDLLDKINVIFGGYCWQMIRTTDTGGVKMIYNGVPLDGACTNNTNRNTNSLIQGSRTTSSMYGTYSYGTDFTYDLTARTFKIAGTIKEGINYSSDKSIIGYYTCKNANKDATCSTLYYLLELNGTSNSPYVYPYTINSTNYAQIGTSQFNQLNTSLSYVGYKYNKIYENKSFTEKTTASYSSSITMFTSSSLNTTYWYADSISFGTDNANNYSLVNPYQVSSTSDYPSLVGKYTFRNTSQTYNYTSVYYIVAVNGSYMYYRQLNSTNISTNYYYGDSYDYGETTSGVYTITNKTQWSSGVDVTGKYVTNGQNASSVYYVIGMNSNRIFYEQLTNGNKLKYNDSIRFADSIEDNHNGTYSLNNSNPVTLSQYFTNNTNYYSTYTCGDANITCKYPRYVSFLNNTSYTYVNPLDSLLIAKTRSGLNLTDTLTLPLDDLVKNRESYSEYKYTCGTTSSTCTASSLRMVVEFGPTTYTYYKNLYFGESATWTGTNYILNNVIEIESAGNTNDISTHHYTCINPTTTQCDAVAYIYQYDGNSTIYYIELSNGIETINVVLNEMLYANDVNTKDSTIKRLTELWYEKNMLSYDSYLEETIYCNDRSIVDLAGFQDDGGLTTQKIQFKQFTATNDLSCTNVTDQFSVDNEDKAKLKYKVGLVSAAEMNMINNNTVRKTGSNYWTISPYQLSANQANNRYIYTSGNLNSNTTSQTYGVRPVISIKYGIVSSSGTGTMAGPYIVE